MVAPKHAMDAVARAIAESGELPAELSLLRHEADMSADDADVDLPLLEIQMVDVDNIVLHNTDLAGFVTDDEGNHVGRIYLSEYELTLSIRLWTTADGGYDAYNLGQRLRDALYPHSSYGPDEPFFDEEGQTIDQITHFRLGVGERDDDLIRTPTVRRWSQEAELWAFEEFSTTEDYIIDVDYPADGDFNDSDDNTVISDT